MTDDRQTRKDRIHIGLIPDGNRRYATQQNLPAWEGHVEGVKRIKEFVDWCVNDKRISMLSIFALSTENIGRSQKEVDALWKLYEEQFKKLLVDPMITENDVKVRIVGNDGLWSPGLKEVIKEVVDSTKHYSRNILNIMLAYGSKFEINRAMKKVVTKPLTSIDKFLFVREPLDLVIRTGDQYRLSNFMLYQASYAEIYFSKVLWPQFSKEEFDKIIDWYFTQVKKWGK